MKNEEIKSEKIKVMPKEEEDQIVESDTILITEEAEELKEDLLSFRNQQSVEMVKTIALNAPKK